MSRYRVPFGATFEPDARPERFEPGAVLAQAAHQMEASSGSREEGTRETTLKTPWGDLQVEARGRGEIVTATPEHAVSDAPVMLQSACQRLGIEPALVDSKGAQIRVVDVGREILVVPLRSPDAVRNAPADADPSEVPMVDVTAGVAYARTQESPYVKLLGRLWGDAEPLTALAAASLHLVRSGTFRPTYPRTRVVGYLVNHGEEISEITVQARKVSGEAKVEALLVGGDVEAVEG